MASHRRSLWFPALLAGGAAAAAWWFSDPARLLRTEFARQRLLAGARTRRATLGDGALCWLQAGHGQDVPLLYVHGFTGMKENWLPLIGAMGRRRTQFAPDLPGWGESERGEDLDYGYAAQAERLAGFIDAVIGQPVDVVGHSMGGGIAATLAARHPDKVRRLALLDAAGVRFSDNAFGQAVLDGYNPFGVSGETSLHEYLGLVFERPPRLTRGIAQWLVQRRLADAGFEERVLDSIGRGEEAFLPEREASAIKAPTLLLWCRGDRVIDASAAAIYASLIPDSRIVLVDGRGHMPMMEATAATAAALKEFLA